MVDVHFTEVQEFLRCQRKWYNSNYLQLEPLEKGEAMLFGGAFHKLKEHHLKPVDDHSYESPREAELLHKLFGVWKQ